MRVQHNIAAMNAYRNYSSNNKSIAKNLEKLSSGYRINRAGDDAAGLAISEKMRAQITGLNVAQKNAKDGISLVQTAEGALTEVHSMLNRMFSLSEQSANGTYDNEVDRANLQKEFSALRTEIDRIADASNFNGQKLLDGSLQKTDAITIEDVAEVKGGSFTVDTASNVAGKNREKIETTAYRAEVAIYDITNTDDTNAQTITFNYKDATGASKKIELEVAADGSASIDDIVSALNSDDGDTVGDITVADDGDSIGGSGTDGSFAELYTVTKGADGNSIVITAKTKADATAGTAIDGNEDKLGGITVDALNAALEPDQGTNVNSFAKVITEVAGVKESDTAATLGSVTLNLVDGEDLVSGSTLKIGSKTIEFLKDGATKAATSDIGIDVTGKTAAEIAKLINDDAGIVNSASGYNVSYAGTKLTITNTVGDGQASTDSDKTKSMETGGDLDVSKAVTFTAAVETKAGTDLTFNAEKLTNNTTVKIGTKSYLLTTDDVASAAGKTLVKYNKDDTAEQIATKFATAVGTGATADGAKVNVVGSDAVSTSSAGLSLQIGDTADSFNILSVEVNDMHAEALGLADLDIGNQKGASSAMDSIKKAINSVSSTRGDLGALQNRLEHTINNLGVMEENIQDAEATIRDTDVAQEMMSYTKNNILVQSAQAMLAQANQLPQGVLQLLG
ncbi:MAG: fliC [Firmicutes bacterium]|nr:fliC [Bacillota bacterium]